jgi:hypothetical protein
MKIASPILMAYPGPPRRAGGLARWLLMAVGFLAILSYVRKTSHTVTLHSLHQTGSPSNLPSAPANSFQPDAKLTASSAGGGEGQTEAARPEAEKPMVADPEAEYQITQPVEPDHPIDTLIQAANQLHEDLLSKESRDINAAAAEYRKKRGRHPPPGFDTWFKFAQDNQAVMVEEFWDQIYHDLGPFWGVPPAMMRKESSDFEMTISIRDRNASAVSGWFWTQIWLNLTQTIEHLLPDMDIALNAMDEPRILLPWEKINQYMDVERATRKMAPPEEVISEFNSLPKLSDPEVKIQPKNWVDKSGCFPNPRVEECTTNTHHRTLLEARLTGLSS